MKYFLITFMLLTSITSFSQGGVRLFFEKPNTFYRQTIIAFTDSTTDQVDVCCDAVRLPGSNNGIWTYIGNTEYSINAFGVLSEDKLVPLGISSSSNDGLFTIGIDQILGDTLPLVLLDNLVPGYHELPYTFSGPVSNRFSILFEKPISLEVVNGCEKGYVVIENDEPSSPYYLTDNLGQTLYLPSYTDTIYDLPSGYYTLSIYDSIPETIYFLVENTVIDATLNIPLTTIYLGDSFVTPILNIYSPYDYIEWDFGDGNFFSNDINPVHYYSQIGTFTLKATIGLGQCLKIFSTQITVNGPLSIIPQNYRDFPKHRPSSFYYAIDGKLIKR